MAAPTRYPPLPLSTPCPRKPALVYNDPSVLLPIRQLFASKSQLWRLQKVSLVTWTSRALVDWIQSWAIWSDSAISQAFVLEKRESPSSIQIAWYSFDIIADKARQRLPALVSKLFLWLTAHSAQTHGSKRRHFRILTRECRYMYSYHERSMFNGHLITRNTLKTALVLVCPTHNSTRECRKRRAELRQARTNHCNAKATKFLTSDDPKKEPFVHHSSSVIWT